MPFAIKVQIICEILYPITLLIENNTFSREILCSKCESVCSVQRISIQIENKAEKTGYLDIYHIQITVPSASRYSYRQKAATMADNSARNSISYFREALILGNGGLEIG